MNTITMLVTMTPEEYETARAWANAYGIPTDELLNYLVNRLEMRREERKAAKMRDAQAKRNIKN